MSLNNGTVKQDESPTEESGRFSAEKMTVQAEALAAKIKDLLHEGNVRRITVKNTRGHTIVEIPVIAGVVAAVAAPVLTAVAAIAAMANDWQVEVHRQD